MWRSEYFALLHEEWHLPIRLSKTAPGELVPVFLYVRRGNIALQATTTIPADGYTMLARPFGVSVEMSPTFQADNSWVVPHNR